MRTNHMARALATGVILFNALACGDRAATSHASSGTFALASLPGATAIQRPLGDLRAAVREQLDRTEIDFGASTREQRELSALYDPSAPVPAWLDGTGHTSNWAREALAILGNAAAEGLDPDDYRAAELDDLASSLDEAHVRPPPAVARLEVGLSLGMLRYLRHVHLGRVDPRAIGFRVTTPTDEHDFVDILRSALIRQKIGDTVAELTPPLVQYRSLREMLVRYRALGADPHLQALPEIRVAVRPGEFYGSLGTLYDWLVALGDLPADTAPPADNVTTYEGAIVAGVTRFQVRHGLEADGVLGHATIAALRVPIAWRVRQIELALERLRWLPDLGDRRFIGVNIPMFHLWAWDSIPPSGAPSFGMGVIVGRALDTQTPVFMEDMRYLIFRPYWNVPSSILRHEILPALQRDAAYLDRHDMEIVSGPGDDAAPVGVSAETLTLLRQGRLRVRQRPGPRNALGLIKFMFPNDANVYMHDTPAPALFSRSRRDFSHGCVRLENPIALAEWALNDQPEWTRERIVTAMSGPASRRVPLTRPIQVILFYITAIVMPEDGAVRFAEDIYGHDTKLDRALTRARQATRNSARSWIDSR